MSVNPMESSQVVSDLSITLETPEARARQRRQTLECVGEVTVNPGPLLAVMHASPNDPEAVAHAIQQCPALTARVLAVTNSAAFPGRGTIERIDRAVIQIGGPRARAIAMALGLRLLSEPAKLAPDLARQLWVASLRKAAAAQLACEQIDARRSSEAYCQALVQDLGLPLLMAVDPAFYEQLTPGHAGEWSAQEQARFGIDHGELGSRLLQSWDAGETLIEATRRHHCVPEAFDGPEACIKLPTFLASLLPHCVEELTGTQRDWLTTLHGQMLAGAYPSPDAFVAEAVQRAEGLTGSSAEPDRALLHGQLAQAVASDAVEFVSQLCRLEGALGRQREGMDKLRYQAFTDALTKLLNRRGFLQLANRRLAEAARRELGACCIVIDLDELKPINDTLGHLAGDHMLRGAAKVLRRALDRADLIARLGGDEFAVLIVGVDDARAREIVERLNDTQTTRLRIGEGDAVPLRFSLGAVHVPEVDPAMSINDLLTLADEAMYSRKRSGKGGARFCAYGESDSILDD